MNKYDVIREMVARRGVRAIAVENFLSSSYTAMSDEQLQANSSRFTRQQGFAADYANAARDAVQYHWSHATLGAIQDGLRKLWELQMGIRQ